MALDLYQHMHTGIVTLVDQARCQSARSVNALMTATYWEIGRRLVTQEQAGVERAAYGQELIRQLSGDLSRRFGRGFSQQNLWQMRAFYLAWPCPEIIQTLSGEFPEIQENEMSMIDLTVIGKRFPLPWSAYVRLLSVKSTVAREFYETEALRCGWSVRQLERQVGSQYYERTALSRNKLAMLAKADSMSEVAALSAQDAFKDPFVLEFLNLKDEYSESDLEDALIEHLADFLLELGDDFAFVGRQRRLRLDDSWFRIDLLLFHRRLRSLIIVELKTGKFSYADAGQMHMYVNYARAHWMKPGENPPIGLILCSSPAGAEAHYALDNLGGAILAAEYRILLPDEQTLVQQLQQSRLALAQRHGLPPA